jgi:two-component system sensor histidine kinase UhpB
MSLRLQLNLLVATLIALFTAVVLAFQIVDTRASVREETEAANIVATRLLSYFIDTYAETSQPIVLQSLERLGRVRSTDITLRDAQGIVVYRSPPSPYKAGRNAPAWYSTLVAPAPMHSELRFADSVLDIEANATRAVLDGWDDTIHLLQLGLLVMVLGNLLVFWLLRRTTRPFQTIVHGLEDMQGGMYHTRLPEFKGAEAGAIARAFNRTAQAVEDNLDARREAVEAKLRLEQSRDLAAAVQARIEDERRQIAQELHDETGQSITAIKSMALALTRRGAGCDAEAHEVAQLIADTAGKLYGAMHDLIPRLRPPALDNLELAEAIEDRVAAWRREQPKIEFALRLGSLPAGLGESYALAAYRIVQEATTNALRHAQAQRIEIALDSDARALHIEVRDDGRGLAPDWQRPGHYGVRGMRERARTLGGDVEIDNIESGGVRVRARLPLE